MRKLPFLLALLLLSLLLLSAAASAHALGLPAAPATGIVLAGGADESEGEGESEEGETDEGEESEGEAGEDGELERGLDETEEAEECLLENASATLAAPRHSDLVRLTVRYRSFAATAVDVDTRLRGRKGGLHLGSLRTRFHRAGVFRDSFHLSPKQMDKARAAREVEVALHAAGTPAECGLFLAIRASRPAR